MSGLPLGMMEELVAQRQAELSRQARQAWRARVDAPSKGSHSGPRAGRHRPLSRGVGRLLVSAGLRLGGPDALRGRVVLMDGAS